MDGGGGGGGGEQCRRQNQPAHKCRLIRTFVVHLQNQYVAYVGEQRMLRSDCTAVHADLDICCLQTV